MFDSILTSNAPRVSCLVPIAGAAQTANTAFRKDSSNESRAFPHIKHNQYPYLKIIYRTRTVVDAAVVVRVVYPPTVAP